MEKGLSKVAFTKPNSRDCCIKNKIPSNSIALKNIYYDRANKIYFKNFGKDICNTQRYFEGIIFQQNIQLYFKSVIVTRI